jgi:hypothetical protein
VGSGMVRTGTDTAPFLLFNSVSIADTDPICFYLRSRILDPILKEFAKLNLPFSCSFSVLGTSFQEQVSIVAQFHKDN